MVIPEDLPYVNCPHCAYLEQENDELLKEIDKLKKFYSVYKPDIWNDENWDNRRLD